MFDSEDVRNLVDIGFIAVSRGLDSKAEAIFAGVRALRPREEAGFIGGALVDLYRGECAEAVSKLRSLQPTDAAQLFLGMALARTGDQGEASQILANVARTAAEPAVTALAAQLLQGIR